MRKHRDRLHALMEALPTAAIFQSGDDRVGYANRRFIEMFGLAEVVDTTPGAPLDPVVDAVVATFADRPDWAVDSTHAIAARRMHRAAQINLTDGRIIRRDVEPLYGDEGELLGSLWTAADITEQMRLEHDLARDNQALTELARQRNEFLALASHSLRTPLTSILSFCELLADPVPQCLNADQRAFLDAIRRNAERMRTVITTLMDTTRLREPQLRLEFGEVEIPRMLEHAVLDRMATTSEAGVFVTLNCEKGPVLYGDEHRLEHVLANLLENAAKFTPAGGRITVSAAPEDAYWSITVADTGIGVPKESREEIFSGFVRAPNAQSGGFPGTGLGLALSREIVWRHGGTLTVNGSADEGEGAVFTLRLPVAGPPEPEADPPPPSRPYRLAPP